MIIKSHIARSDIFHFGLRISDSSKKSGFRTCCHKPSEDISRMDFVLISKGERYFCWKHKNSPWVRSAKYPTMEQLRKYGKTEWEQFEEDVLDYIDGIDEVEKERLRENEELDDFVKQMEDMLEELKEKLSNMEQYFPNGCPTMELIQERIEMIEYALDELNS